MINQIETHLYCQRTAEHTWEDKCNVAHMAYAPLGQGHANEMFKEETVQKLAQKYHKTPAQILLRRTIQDGVAVIPKSVHEERMEENINVFDFSLTDEEMRKLRELDKAQAMIGNPQTRQTSRVQCSASNNNSSCPRSNSQISGSLKYFKYRFETRRKQTYRSLR